jgi:DNA-binding NarL/FixJ family response regulator
MRRPVIRILMADDHALVREGLKQLFALGCDVEVAAEATDGANVLELLQHGHFDLVLMDMTMPGISGINLIEHICARQDAPPILVLSMHNEVQMARRALAAGASGYLTKDCQPEMLIAAIHRVASGARFIDMDLAHQMVLDAGSPERKPPHERLSERESQILRLLVGGMSINDIAKELSISNKTVSTHKARLMQKMTLQSNAELMRYAFLHGLAR